MPEQISPATGQMKETTIHIHRDLADFLPSAERMLQEVQRHAELNLGTLDESRGNEREAL